MGDESYPVKKRELAFAAPSSSSFNCYCRFKKIFNSLKLRTHRVESGRKVLLKSDHGTTRPTRGAESRDPMPSGKRSVVLLYPYWCCERCERRGAKGKIAKRDRNEYSEEISVRHRMMLAVYIGDSEDSEDFRVGLGYFLDYFATTWGGSFFIEQQESGVVMQWCCVAVIRTRPEYL